MHVGDKVKVRGGQEGVIVKDTSRRGLAGSGYNANTTYSLYIVRHADGTEMEYDRGELRNLEVPKIV